MDETLVKRILDGLDGLGREVASLATEVREGRVADREHTANRVDQIHDVLTEMRDEARPVLQAYVATRAVLSLFIKIGAVASAAAAVWGAWQAFS